MDQNTPYACAKIGAAGLVMASSLLTLAAPVAAQVPKIGDPPEASNMRLVGYNDLQARSSYQPTVVHQGDRWILYVGHHGGTDDIPKPMNTMTGQAEFNGTSVVDVTDPKNPKYLAHIPAQEGLYEGGGAQMVRVCSGATLPKADKSKTYLLRTFGKAGHEVWDVTEPGKPQIVTRIGIGSVRDTHKNAWECDTGIAYLISAIPGFRTRTIEIYDLSDPAHPVKIRDFGLVGQEPGGTGPIPTQIHGPISTGAKGNRVYFGYGTNKAGYMQIVDREKLLNGPKEPTPENFLYPQVGRLDLMPTVGAHTTLPLGKIAIPNFVHDKFGKERDMVMIVNEETANECGEARNMVWFADVTIEAHPMIVSNYTVPSGNFCERGGRFGAHSSNENMGPPYYGKLAFITWFNAGLRVLDIRNPYQPKEVAYFIPPITAATDKRCVKAEGGPRCKVAIQSNNAETDERGYIYLVDRANTGLHILELTGEPRSIAGLQ
jgi:hypothetical protein